MGCLYFFRQPIGKLTIRPDFCRTCDLESLVASGHKKIWRPPAANMGFSDFKDVVAFGNNQLWRPLAAKVKVHHIGLPQKMASLPYGNPWFGSTHIQRLVFF